MPQPPLARRVEILEEKVGALERLPGRMDALELQIMQFREEVRVEFSAIRQEAAASMDALRAEMRDGDEETRRYMRVLHEDVISRIALLHLVGGTTCVPSRPASL